jgi:hypothetical protein
LKLRDNFFMAPSLTDYRPVLKETLFEEEIKFHFSCHYPFFIQFSTQLSLGQEELLNGQFSTSLIKNTSEVIWFVKVPVDTMPNH